MSRDVTARLENEIFNNLTLISWNINGGQSTKIKDEGFRTFLQTYDVVLLIADCWLKDRLQES